MDAAATPEQPDDWTGMAELAFRRFWRRARPVLMAAGAFGSAGNIAFAALLGSAAFLVAVLTSPIDAPARAASPRQDTHPSVLTEASMDAARPQGLVATVAPAPVGVAPAAAVETVLDYAVAFYWPATPQTVIEPVAIRDGPAPYARIIRAARPGERLRINGKSEEAPGGPWLRVRLADGQDGYFAARTVDVGSFRRRRAADVETAAVSGDDSLAAASGAPLIVDRTVSEQSELGPPSF